LLARGGNRRGSCGARPYWRGVCQHPVCSGSQNFDRRGHPASRRGASVWLLDAGVFGRPDLSQPVIVRGAYRYADRHADTHVIGYPNRHADTHVIGYSNRHADTQAVAQAVQALAKAAQATAHSLRAPERRAVADRVRLAARHGGLG
jgi:hypothetical protein